MSNSAEAASAAAAAAAAASTSSEAPATPPPAVSNGIHIRPVEFEIAIDTNDVGSPSASGGAKPPPLSDAAVLQLMAAARSASSAAAAAEARLGAATNPTKRLVLAAALKDAMAAEQAALRQVKEAIRTKKLQQVQASNGRQGHSDPGSQQAASQVLSAGAVTALKQCRHLYDEGLISDEDYEREKAEIFSRERLVRHVQLCKTGLVRVAQPKPVTAPGTVQSSVVQAARGGSVAVARHHEHQHLQRLHNATQMQRYAEDSVQGDDRFQNSAHSRIMLKHRQEHFEVLSGEVEGLISDFEGFVHQLSDPRVVASGAAMEPRLGDKPTALLGEGNLGANDDVPAFIKSLATKMQHIKQGLSLVEAVPWPREVLLQDPQVSKVSAHHGADKKCRARCWDFERRHFHRLLLL